MGLYEKRETFGLRKDCIARSTGVGWVPNLAGTMRKSPPSGWGEGLRELTWDCSCPSAV